VTFSVFVASCRSVSVVQPSTELVIGRASCPVHGRSGGARGAISRGGATIGAGGGGVMHPPPFSKFSVFTVLPDPPTFQCIDTPPHTFKFVPPLLVRDDCFLLPLNKACQNIAFCWKHVYTMIQSNSRLISTCIDNKGLLLTLGGASSWSRVWPETLRRMTMTTPHSTIPLQLDGCIRTPQRSEPCVTCPTAWSPPRWRWGRGGTRSGHQLRVLGHAPPNDRRRRPWV